MVFVLKRKIKGGLINEVKSQEKLDQAKNMSINNTVEINKESTPLDPTSKVSKVRLKKFINFQF